VVRNIFRPKREDVSGDTRKLHNEKLHNVYSSNKQVIVSSTMRWDGHVARMRYKRNAYRILLGKAEGKRLL
jgi:hypothetical protein